MLAMRGLVLTILMICGAFGAHAHEVRQGDLEIVHPRLIIAEGKGGQGRLVFELINHGAEAARLTGVDDRLAAAEISANDRRHIAIDDVVVDGPVFAESMERFVLKFADGREIAIDAITIFAEADRPGD